MWKCTPSENTSIVIEQGTNNNFQNRVQNCFQKKMFIGGYNSTFIIDRSVHWTQLSILDNTEWFFGPYDDVTEKF